MPKLTQVSFAAGEIDPALAMRADLARYAIALKGCRNFFVRATGGASNRAGTQFVSALNPDSRATLIPFIFSTEQAYMIVLQEESVAIFTNGAFVAGISGVAITNVTFVAVTATKRFFEVTTGAPHGLIASSPVDIAGVTGTGNIPSVNGSWIVTVLVSPTVFRVQIGVAWSGTYTSGGTLNGTSLQTDYVSADLAAIRYTQSADVLTLAHKVYPPSELVRTDATTFTFDEIADFESGPFLDDNVTPTMITASAHTGVGITLSASQSIFTPEHVGALFRIDMSDLSGIPPWEASKVLAVSTVNPFGLLRRANGKVYSCATNEVAGADGTFTGTVRPSHDEGTEDDGDGNPVANFATRAGVAWTYLHSLFGVARISAQAGGTATADVISYIPTLSATDVWSFGAWSEEQGYPGVVTYFGDRLVFANTPGQPQTEWASKVADYHNFGISNPLVDDDSIRQTLNAKQVNAIVELVPVDQLVALTSSSSWASPRRGEIWTPGTIGFDPQSANGAADLRALVVGDNALMVERGAQRVRELKFLLDIDKFGGEELSVMSRHLFGPTKYIVDWDYAKDPHGIVWVVRSDGALIGLTYLPEQQVIGWHRHDTDGFFERVCVIPEDGRDVPYFVVRRTVNGESVRYLERMAAREIDDQIDGYFVDCGLTYDGRNTTATTITVSGASYEGGDTVTLAASASVFAATDVDDAIQFDDVRIRITAYSSATSVTGQLETPLPAALQATASAEWTFAHNTFAGLDHLEGKTVAICADGVEQAQQVVTGGTVTLSNAAGIVHIGLPYSGELETLNVTVFGGDQIRDRAKTIPQVSVVVQDTVGLKAGPDADHLEELTLRSDEFYTNPLAAVSDVTTAYLLNTWNKSGRVVLRQDGPLPATVLAILPKVMVGGDG